MDVKLVEIKGSYEQVANRARTTVNKTELGKDPSEAFKRKILMAEHSPIRSLIYCFKIDDVKSWVATHFVRHHVGVEKWVSTQRSDRTGVNRDEAPQGTKVNMEMEANAQAMINMGRKRLCSQASADTRKVMQAMKDEVAKQDPYLADIIVKECVYRGFCPEMQSCGYDKTPTFQLELQKYRDTIKVGEQSGKKNT